MYSVRCDLQASINKIISTSCSLVMVNVMTRPRHLHFLTGVSVSITLCKRAERPVLKLLLLGFFWFTTLCTDYRQFGREEPPISYSLPKLKIFGVIWGIPAQKKLCNNLENARKTFNFCPMSTNPLVNNYETYKVNATL